MKILGISCYYHDSAAVLIVDGKVVAAAEEERFTRIKHDSEYPANAIKFCLKEAGVKPNDINWVVFYEKPFLKVERIVSNFLATTPSSSDSFVSALKVWLKTKLWIKEKISKDLGLDPKKILFVKHHLSHAASAFCTSSFDKAAIITCDGVGEWATTTWGLAENNKISLKQEIKYPHSLGLFYSTFTQFLGFQVNEGEFKVMGLAPYGKPVYVDRIEPMIKQSTDGSFKLDLSYFRFQSSDKVSFSQKFINALGAPAVDPKDSDQVTQVYADIAASVQQILNEKLLVIAKYVKKRTNADNLVYSGGVALNGVSNWKIFKEAGFTNLHIHPAAGDSGGALGAALYVYHHVLNKPRIHTIKNVYLGQANKDPDITAFFEGNNIKYQKLNDKNLVQKVSNMLTEGKVVGWVRGGFEWGPRALGNRSIIADPRSKKMKDRVNIKIKFRESFRPFAPATIYEKATDYYELKKSDLQQPLEYMIAVVPVKANKRLKLGAVTHVDGTARPQLVKRESNPLYYDLINSFGKKTGVYTLLNTSFNLKGEPIVNTVSDAYKTFKNSGLDALVVENYLIIK